MCNTVHYHKYSKVIRLTMFRIEYNPGEIEEEQDLIGKEFHRIVWLVILFNERINRVSKDAHRAN